MSSTASEESERCAPVPRGKKRRREIAIVAERVFFTHGFTDTTMQTIAAEAGASKETLYRHFGSKEGLFSEIVEARANRFFEGVDDDMQRSDPVADVLRHLGDNILRVLTDPDALSLCRVVIAEAPHNPNLGQIFYDEGPHRVLKRLARFIEGATARGELCCANSSHAASVFLGAILSQYYIIGLVLPDRPRTAESTLRAHVAEVVALFLQRYQGDTRDLRQAPA